MPNTALLLMQCVTSSGLRLRRPTATMGMSLSVEEEDIVNVRREEREESILAMLGITGTILNLIVIIFVYIYTTA